VKNILQKLDQPNRTRAVLYALRSGLVSLGDVAD
jgi:DNA-binding NarL/FixJ family response regulator